MARNSSLLQTMKTLLLELKTSIIATIVLAIVCSGLYPLVIWGIGQVIFPFQANGSLIEAKDGTVVGSALLAQGFSGEKYFHPRPSAAGTGYDPTASGGSSLGPTSQKLIEQIKQNVEGYRKENGLADNVQIPADAVTNSGSGLDPHISLENALLQAPRVAKARNLDVAVVKKAIQEATENSFLRIGGEPGVNVLKLNLALDNLPPASS
jgi:potassium-transporting ATPase KdpC subunit